MLNDQFNNGEGMLAQNTLGGFGQALPQPQVQAPLLGGNAAVPGLSSGGATPWTLGNWQFTPVDHNPFAYDGAPYNGPAVPTGMSAAEQATFMAQRNALGGMPLLAQTQTNGWSGNYGTG